MNNLEVCIICSKPLKRETKTKACRKHSYLFRRNYSGVNNPAYKNGSWIRMFTYCKKCGIKVCKANRSGFCWHCNSKKGVDNPMYGKHMLPHTKRKLSKMMSGKNNPAYIHGKSSEYDKKHSKYNWMNKRQKVLFRFKYKCYNCNSNTNLDVHHIIPWSISKNDKYSNLMVLCRKCHLILENKIRKIIKENQFPFICIIACTYHKNFIDPLEIYRKKKK
jgi:5-methylcytosine-specific restriction endonuclease McrA